MPARQAPSAERSAAAATPRDPNAATAPRGPTAANAPRDPTADALERAEILALRLAGKPNDGRFDATLSLGASPPPGTAARVRIAPAQQRAPLVYRRPLAFHRLARGLGAHIVPVAAARRLGIGELAALLERDPAAHGLLQGFAVVNDGTVDALVTALAPGPRWEQPRGRSIPYATAPEFSRWEGWASSLTPLPNERTPLLRDYVEMLMLDYLAGNSRRKDVVLDDAAGALILDENDNAFPLHVKARELDPLLRRLTAAARFPRSFHESLIRFGRIEATAALNIGGFEEALIPPRALIELEERRAALVTLIEAKISAQGARATLSL